jgi:hypothetical protein
MIGGSGAGCPRFAKLTWGLCHSPVMPKEWEGNGFIGGGKLAIWGRRLASFGPRHSLERIAPPSTLHAPQAQVTKSLGALLSIICPHRIPDDLHVIFMIRARADKQFTLLKTNPQYPSLQFKKLADRKGQEIWSARVTLKYRALAVKLPDEYVCFWIGEHNVYDTLIK